MSCFYIIGVTAFPKCAATDRTIPNLRRGRFTRLLTSCCVCAANTNSEAADHMENSGDIGILDQIQFVVPACAASSTLLCVSVSLL